MSCRAGVGESTQSNVSILSPCRVPWYYEVARSDGGVKKTGGGEKVGMFF